MIVTDPVKFIISPSRFPEIDAIRERTLHELIDRLLELEGDNLIRVVLFGSVARGDGREDSDTDVFILLRDTRGDSIEHVIDRIIDITVNIDISTGECCTHLTPIVYDQEALYDVNRLWGFLKNVDKDGVVLYDSTNCQ